MFNRKYKKGMADAAKAYEAFGKKQEDALNHILEEVRAGKLDMEEALKQLNGSIDGLYDYLRSKEKAKLYTVYTPFDIKNLEQPAKLFLVGALYALTIDRMPTENQQNYLRAVQKYLDIKEPPFGVNPMAIENIEDIPTQKAILQVVLEFLRLQDGDCYDETEFQQDFLDAFSVNSKSRHDIMDHIELLFTATGAKGLAEKYGYVPEEESTESESTEGDENPTEDSSSSYSGEFIELKEEFADNLMRIREDRYKVSYCIETAHYCLVLPTSVKSIDKRTGERISFSNLPDRIVEVQALGNGTDTVAIEFRKEQGDKTITIVALYDLINDSYTELDCGGEIKLLRAKGNFVVYGDTASHDVFLYNICTQKTKELPSFDTFRVEAADIVGNTLYVVVNTSPNLICTVNLTDFSIQKKMKCSLGCNPNNIRVIGSNLLYAEKKSFMFGTLRLTIGKMDINSGNLNQIVFSNGNDHLKLSLQIYDNCFIYRDSPQGAIWIIGTGYDEACKLVRESSGQAESLATAIGVLWNDSPLDRFPRVGKWVYFTKDGSKKVYKVSIDQPLQTEIVC